MSALDLGGGRVQTARALEHSPARDRAQTK
jgi:hypothetical protein